MSIRRGFNKTLIQYINSFRASLRLLLYPRRHYHADRNPPINHKHLIQEPRHLQGLWAGLSGRRAGGFLVIAPVSPLVTRSQAGYGSSTPISYTDIVVISTLVPNISQVFLANHFSFSPGSQAGDAWVVDHNERTQYQVLRSFGRWGHIFR